MDASATLRIVKGAPDVQAEASSQGAPVGPAAASPAGGGTAKPSRRACQAVGVQAEGVGAAVAQVRVGASTDAAANVARPRRRHVARRARARPRRRGREGVPLFMGSCFGDSSKEGLDGRGRGRRGSSERPTLSAVMRWWRLWPPGTVRCQCAADTGDAVRAHAGWPVCTAGGGSAMCGRRLLAVGRSGGAPVAAGLPGRGVALGGTSHWMMIMCTTRARGSRPPDAPPPRSPRSDARRGGQAAPS